MKFFLIVTNSRGPVIFQGHKGTNTRGELTFFAAGSRSAYDTSDVLLWQECATEQEAQKILRELGLEHKAPAAG
jgi:hypothetical protein